MLGHAKRTIATLAAALLAALGLTVVTAGAAFAWPDKDIQIQTDCNGVTLTGVGFEYNDQTADSIRWSVDTEPPTEGKLTLDSSTQTIQLPPGHYHLEWKLVIRPGKVERGEPKEFDVPTCPSPQASLACADEGLVLTLTNDASANSDAEFTVDANGTTTSATVAPGGSTDVPVDVPEGENYSVKVTAMDSDLQFDESGVVDCEEETPSESPPTSASPTPPANEEAPPPAPTLPHTGAGFPTGVAAAFALFLLSAGGFLLTYRKGMLPVLRRKH